MAITWANVVDIDADLANVPVGGQNAILAQVLLRLSAAQWGTKLDLASVYLAAHHGVLSRRGSAGAGGPIQSESIGGVSQSYAVFSPNGSDPFWDQSPWGKVFRQLLRELVPTRGPMVL